jgi:RNA polymerase sigma-70 factor (ECF subfamily)
MLAQERISELDGWAHTEALRFSSIMDPADLAQETLLRAIEKRHLFRDDEESNLKGWLARMMRHIAIDVYRRAKIEQELDFDLEAGPERVEFSDAFWHGVESLAPERREVLMCKIQGLTREETARKLNIPSGTVCSRMSRAFDDMKNIMEIQDAIK